MHQNKTHRVEVKTFIALLAFALGGPGGFAAGTAGLAGELITIDGQSVGRVFDGIGGVSAGASSRLLYDYPEPQRSDILDYLFKPNYGASMQVLKVEIGGDMNSTDGSESSHMRTADEVNCERGYEWWLMKEAKARNHNIVLMGLEWGAPGWFQRGFWSDDNIGYIIKWLDCAAAKGLKIDYMGGWNERKFDPDWYVKMSRAVKEKYPHIRVIAADDCTDIWKVAYAMSTNAAFCAAVDVVGVHFACGHRSQHEHCSSPPVALALNKPLWMSENSAQGHDIGAVPWARALNRMYIDAKVTAALCWPPVCGWYANLPLADTGIILAAWPWSGHYRVGKTVWVYAHTAQFVQPGWQYLDKSCGYLKDGGSYVCFKSNKGEDYSVVIETADATAPQQVTFSVGQGLSTAPVKVWKTDLRSNQGRDFFNHRETVEPRSGAFSLTLESGCLYSLTTTTGQKKGTAVPPATVATRMPLPFREDFDAHRPGQLARFFSDITGGFETAPCAGGRNGMCYRQSATTAPISWGAARSEMPPTTLAGDPRWWGDYQLSCDVLLEEPGYVELLARVSVQRGPRVAGYHLQLSDTGAWQLYSQDTDGEDISLGTGTIAMSTGTWHKVVFRLVGDRLQASVDGKVLSVVQDRGHLTGQIGLRAAVGKRAQFDNVEVVTTGSPPKLIPHAAMRATATSEHAGWYRGWNYAAANAIDDRPEMCWSTEWMPVKPALPQAITLDLGKLQEVTGLLYWPRLDSPDGRITRYRVALSTDAKTFNQVAEGSWNTSSATRMLSWSKRTARYVRLEALAGVKGMASAAEIDITTSSPSAQSAPPVIPIDMRGSGRTFDGFGGLSAGASSRLLFDYPEPERSQILDYLFKPNFGANLQILKVEIGGDSNSTCGSEASHMRSPTDLNGGRGYEWWLMKEAKKRNPDIKLWGLQWCAPGWFKGGFWSKDNIDFLLAWLRLAEQQGLKIDYMGGWNESGSDPDWYAAWHKALAEHYPHIKIVAADDGGHSWKSVAKMVTNATLRAATDIIGVHDPDGARTAYARCVVPDYARQLNKTIWDSELSSQGHDVGAVPLARGLNRQYVEGHITANVVWSLISAWYADLPLADTGLMLADRPWSGYYRIGKSIWVHAHTTQFTRVDWQYIDKACGYLPNGTSYVTLKSPDGRDFTTVIETMDTSAPQSVSFDVSGGLPVPRVHVWSSDLASSDTKDYFVCQRSLRPKAGGFSLVLQPHHLYTLSTTTGQAKGDARPKAGPAQQVSLPYRETFESYGSSGKLARFFSDLEGGFETAPCGGGRTGWCYRHAVPTQPITWGSRKRLPPTTVMGDPRWWGDYEVGVDALLEQDGAVELLGRVSSQRTVAVAGYHFQVTSHGQWTLYTEDLGPTNTTLATGTASFPVGTWHRLGLRFRGRQIEALFDGQVLTRLVDDHHTTGQIGLRVNSWIQAQFDNVSVTKTDPWPEFVPHSQMHVTATSDHPANTRGYTFEAANAIDDRPETAWSAEWEPLAPLPQSITLDLGRNRTIHGLVCQPRLDSVQNWWGRTLHGYLSNYRIYLSRDGKTFNVAASGAWPLGTATRSASWPAQSARYVRLEATERSEGAPAAAEINIALTPSNTPP